LVPVNNLEEGLAVRYQFKLQRKDLRSFIVILDNEMFVLINTRLATDLSVDINFGERPPEGDRISINDELGYRGYYTIDGFEGFLKSKPIKYNVKIELGTPVISYFPSEPQDKVLSVDLAFYRSDFLSFSDDEFENERDDELGILMELFGLSFSIVVDRNKFGRIIEKLWKCGKFLSDWATSIYINTGRMSYSDFFIEDKIKNGSDDMYNGNMAIKYIESLTCE